MLYILMVLPAQGTWDFFPDPWSPEEKTELDTQKMCQVGCSFTEGGKVHSQGKTRLVERLTVSALRRKKRES